MQRLPVLRAARTLALGLLALWLLALWLLAGTAWAQTGPAAQRVQRLQLANGLEVLLAEDRRLPQVALNLWLHAGPRQEGPGQVGMGFLVEHLLFAGSRHIPPGRADALVAAAGGTEFSGNTSFERSAYGLLLPAHQLELGLWVLADMLGWSFEGLDAAALQDMQQRIREERRRNVEQRPYGIADEALYAALFPPGHPYRAAVIGGHADIQAFTLDGVREFARNLVRPNNATLVLAGDFDALRVRQLLGKHFGSLKPGPVVASRTVAQPVIASEQRVTVTDAVELPRLTLAWHTPPAFQPGDAELDLAAGVLGGGRLGRLARALMQERALAASVDVSQYSLGLGSIFSIEAVARPGVSLQALQAAIDEELAALATQGPSEAEVQRASAGVQTRLLHRVDRLAGLAEQLNTYQRLAGNANHLERDLARYREATPEAVRAAVARHLRPEARVALQTLPGPQLLPPVPESTSAAGPAGTGAAGTPARRPAAAAPPDRPLLLNAPEPWRLTPPNPAPPAALLLPDGQRQQLPNGLMVVHLPRPGLPLASATLVLRAGLDRNPPERPGLASFTAALLEQGTRDRSATELAQAVALLGGSLAVDFGAEDLRITVATMPHHLPDALGLVAEMVLRPAFAPDAIARLKGERLAALEDEGATPGSAADLAARAAFYGPGHPLAASRLGSPPHIEATTRNEILAFWRSAYRPDEAALVVSGDVDADSALRLARVAFGGWRAPPGNTAPWQTPAPRPGTPGVLLLDTPGASHGSLQLMAPAPQPDTPEAAVAAVLHHALSAMPGALLPRALSPLGGATAANLPLGRSQAAWVLRASLPTEATAAGLTALLRQLQALRSEPLAPEALQRARSAALQALPAGFDTLDAATRRLAGLWALDLPGDHLARWPRQLAGVTAAQLQQLARQMLEPAGLRLVLVGDAARLQPGLQAALPALGLGPLQVLAASQAAPAEAPSPLSPPAQASEPAAPGSSAAPSTTAPRPTEPRTP